MTQQELFDTVVAGLASQGFERSMGKEGCAYRGEEGRKCAAGWVLPNERYKESMEGSGVGQDLIRDVFVSIVGEENMLFLSLLQGAHDHSESPSFMKTELVHMGERYGLKIPQVLK